jgi:hypothetical protein
LPERELLALLTNHILGQEGVRDHGEANDLAVEFLNFIRERAGLLIEVGEKKFSFVHLTFQEYLASTRLAADMELGGAQELWKNWSDRTCDPKWHEVFRLLVENLKSESSQNYFVEQIISLNRRQENLERLYLLAGIISDGTATKSEDIDYANQKLLALTGDKRTSDYSRLISAIRSLWQKQPAALEESFRKFWRLNESGRLDVLLGALAVGLSIETINEIAAPKRLLASSSDIELCAAMFGGQPITDKVSPETAVRLTAFQNALSLGVVSNPMDNQSAVRLQGLFVNNGAEAEWYFCRSLLALLIGHGPFFDYFRFWTLYSLSEGDSLSKIQRIALKRERGEIGVDRPRSTVNKSLEKALDDAGGIGGCWGVSDRGVWNIRSVLTAKANKGKGRRRENNRLPTSEDAVLLVVDSLRLEPQGLWSSAIQQVAMPRVERDGLKLNETLLAACIQQAGRDALSDVWAFRVAIFLIYSIWLRAGTLEDVHDPVEELARLVKENDHPAVRIADDLRRAALGERVDLWWLRAAPSELPPLFNRILDASCYRDAMSLVKQERARPRGRPSAPNASSRKTARRGGGELPR